MGPHKAPYCDRGDRRVIVVRAGFHLDAPRGRVHVEQPAGRWIYAVAIHANPGDDPIFGEIRLESLSRPRDRCRVPTKSGELECSGFRGVGLAERTATRLAHDATIPVSLGREGWTFHVLAPVLGSGLAVIGDVTKFVTAGDARIEVAETSTGVRLVVKGPGETVTVTGWAQVAPTSPDASVAYDPSIGVWTATIDVPSRGWTTLVVDA